MPRILLLALGLAACGGGAARRGDTVMLASGADLQSPNPLLSVHPLAKQVQRYALLVTLVKYDSALAVIPYFAREWRWSRDSATLTFTTFARLRWHDGVATTAHDAVFTLEAARDPATGYPRQSDLSSLLGAEAPDDTTLVLRFSAPPGRVPDVLTDLALVPRHLLGEVPRAALRSAEWNRRPVGNGPFRFVAYEPNRRWVFEAQPDFPAELGGPPRLNRFVVAVVDEPTTKLAALTSGELDIAGIHPAHAEFVRRDPRLTVLDYPLLFSYALIFNTRRPPFDRLETRRAVAGAIERGPLVDGALFGFGTPATGPLPPALASSGPDGPPTPAVQTATAPGLRFELLTVGSGEAALEQMLQAQLAERGIRVDLRLLELSTYLDRVQGVNRAFEAAVMGVPGDLELGHLARLYALAGLQAPDSRETLIRQLDESLPAAMLYHARGVQGINRRVKGVVMDLRGELVTLAKWTVDAGR